MAAKNSSKVHGDYIHCMWGGSPRRQGASVAQPRNGGRLAGQKSADGAERARLHARSQTNCAASALQCPYWTSESQHLRLRAATAEREQTGREGGRWRMLKCMARKASWARPQTREFAGSSPAGSTRRKVARQLTMCTWFRHLPAFRILGRLVLGEELGRRAREHAVAAGRPVADPSAVALGTRRVPLVWPTQDHLQAENCATFCNRPFCILVLRS